MIERSDTTNPKSVIQNLKFSIIYGYMVARFQAAAALTSETLMKLLYHPIYHLRDLLYFQTETGCQQNDQKHRPG